jgi:hypothetical protein
MLRIRQQRPAIVRLLQRIRFHCLDLGIAPDWEEECNDQIAIRHEHCGAGECRGRPGSSGRRENVKVGSKDDTFDGDITKTRSPALE